jgi:hypothetical protein
LKECFAGFSRKDILIHHIKKCLFGRVPDNYSLDNMTIERDTRCLMLVIRNDQDRHKRNISLKLANELISQYSCVLVGDNFEGLDKGRVVYDGTEHWILARQEQIKQELGKLVNKKGNKLEVPLNSRRQQLWWWYYLKLRYNIKLAVGS